MPDNEIKFTFRADDQASSTFNRVKRELAELEAYGGKIFDAFNKLNIPMGRAKQLMTPQDRAAVEAYENALRRVASTTNAVGEASKRAGFNVDGMIKHMVTRMAVAAAIFEAIRLATKGIQEAIQFEAVSTRFTSLIGSSADAANAFKAIQTEAKTTGTSKEALMELELELKKVGLSAGEATRAMGALDQYAVVTGEDAKKLAQEFANVRLGRGSAADMLDLSFAMGPAGESLHQQVVDYEQINTELPRMKREQDAILADMDRQFTLMERQRDAIQRLQSAQQSFADTIGITADVFEALQQGQHPFSTLVDGVDLERAYNVMEKTLELGERQIEQEEGISEGDVKHLERLGLINAKMLEGAAQREREAERIEAQQKREDEHYRVQKEFQDAELAQQRTLVALQQEIAAAVEDRTGLEKSLAAYQETAEASIKRFQESLSEVMQNMPELTKDVKAIADILTSWVNNIQNFGDVLQAILHFKFFGIDVFPQPPQDPHGSKGVTGTWDENSKVTIQNTKSIQDNTAALQKALDECLGLKKPSEAKAEVQKLKEEADKRAAIYDRARGGDIKAMEQLPEYWGTMGRGLGAYDPFRHGTVGTRILGPDWALPKFPAGSQAEALETLLRGGGTAPTAPTTPRPHPYIPPGTTPFPARPTAPTAPGGIQYPPGTTILHGHPVLPPGWTLDPQGRPVRIPTPLPHHVIPPGLPPGFQSPLPLPGSQLPYPPGFIPRPSLSEQTEPFGKGVAQVSAPELLEEMKKLNSNLNQVFSTT